MSVSDKYPVEQMPALNNNPLKSPQSRSYQKALEDYQQKKNKLIKQYQQLMINQKKEVQLKKNTSNLFRTRKNVSQKIDVRQFNKVLNVDPKNLIADIEGMTSYEHIVDETLKYHCLPTVVPQLKSITIGGALAGGGIEASSFKYGLVHETILEFELLLGDGRVVLCTPTNEHADLFYAFPNTYGTLGYALRIKVKLIPAKKYVKLNHSRFSEATSYFENINNLCQKNRNPTSPIAYIDGVVFNQNDLIISTGEFTDQAPFTSNYKYLNIYYLSLQKKTIDYLTTKDFIWRWDSDWFWCSKHFFMQNFIMRLLFGKFFLNSITFWKLRNFFNKNKIAKFLVTYLQGKTEAVIQDVEIPVSHAKDFLTFFNRNIKVLPIWICPTQPYQDKKFDFYPMDPNTLYINFGFWDALPSLHPDGFFNKQIERKVQELRGHKSLYSNVYYTKDQFWSIFNHALYEQLKAKYDPTHHLKDLYQKCSEKNKT